MVRKQIRITPAQAAAVGREAARRKISESAIVREAVDRLLAHAKEDAWVRALSVVGKFHSGESDVAERHDAYYANGIYEHIQERRIP